MQKRSTAGFARTTDQPLLICFSHLRWDFVWQRPQHLLSRAAKDYRVVVIEEPVYEAGAAVRMRIEERPGGITLATPVLPEGTLDPDAVVAQRTLVDDLLAGERAAPRVFWYYTPMALAFSGHLDCDLCVYDNMDELSAFRGASPRLLELEEQLFARADVVFTGGMSLYEAKRSRHRNVHCFPSSIDTAHFGVSRKQEQADPQDQAGIARPRLGFFGVIDERMDIDLVAQAAELRPEWQFVMIGPVVKIDPASLPQRDNIHWLGGKPYAELPQYLRHWDIGFMPFAQNEATRFISPTKTPEFLAAGVPVVSTPIMDVVRPYGEEGLVEIAMTPLEAVRKAEGLMERSEAVRADWLARVDRHLAAGSWDKTWEAINREMRSILAFDATERAAPASLALAAAPAPAE